MPESPQVLDAEQLKAAARQYGLPWPPPRQIDEIERARKEAMLRYHPDRGGSPDAAQRINAWCDAVRAVREKRAVVGRRRVPQVAGPRGFQFEIPFGQILETIMRGQPVPPPTVRAEVKPSDNGEDFVFRINFDFGRGG